MEHVLNYGDWDDAQKMIKILGIKKTAKIFYAKSKPSKMGRQNYTDRTKHFFTLYFNKYVRVKSFNHDTKTFFLTIVENDAKEGINLLVKLIFSRPFFC